MAFENQDPSVNTMQFQAAIVRREELEAAYGRPLEFEDLDGRKSCRIADYRDGDVERADEWNDYIYWLISRQAALRTAFGAVGGIRSLIATGE